MAEPDENPFGDPTVGHPFQVMFKTLLLLSFNYQNKKIFINLIAFVFKDLESR